MSDLKSKLQIDINRLQFCCQEQPELASRAGELAAMAKSKAKRAKVVLEEAKANANKEIRDNPDGFGVPKVTEKAVESAVVLHPDVMKVAQDVIELELDADKAAVLANAFEHRRSMLKIEAELFVHNYWGSVEVKESQMAGPSSDIADATEEKVGERIGRRRRRNA